jgi:hypothetical protein
MCKKKKQKNNVDYGEAFVPTLSNFLDDITWYIDFIA